MSHLLSAPSLVVMTARGKDKIDERGNMIEYAYEGERCPSFLANVVIEYRREYDIVVKDRTGTHTEKKNCPRVAFTDFLPLQAAEFTALTQTPVPHYKMPHLWQKKSYMIHIGHMAEEKENFYFVLTTLALHMNRFLIFVG